MPTIITQQHKNGLTYAVGSALVLNNKANKIRITEDEALGTIASFSGVVEVYETGGLLPSGRKAYERSLMYFVAYGSIAHYVRDFLYPGALFFFTGQVMNDPYFTQKNGYPCFRIVMDFCSVQNRSKYGKGGRKEIREFYKEAAEPDF